MATPQSIRYHVDKTSPPERGTSTDEATSPRGGLISPSALMQHYKSLENIKLSQSWVTLGIFDGVHRGHQHVIRQLVSQAHQAKNPAVVVTFHPHPALVLSGKTLPIYLTTPDYRAELLEQLGVDIVITHPFNSQIANLTAAEFITRLNSHLNMRQLWIGYDFALGKDRKGTASELRQLGDEHGYVLEQALSYRENEQIVSSTWIRELLAVGNVGQAADLLGRPHRVGGVVVGGDKRGAGIGFPTANLTLPPTMARLQSGVYACYAWLGETRWKSVANFGIRPTFEDEPVTPRFEVHLLDFSGDIYGESLTVEFISFLREEQKFENIEALKAQIEKDVKEARQVLA